MKKVLTSGGKAVLVGGKAMVGDQSTGDTYSKAQLDNFIGTISDLSAQVENLWPNNITMLIQGFQTWGKLCIFTLQFNVTAEIASSYGFHAIKLPRAPNMRIWINNETAFYIDGGSDGVRVNGEKLNAGNYILSGMYLSDIQIDGQTTT